MKRNIKVITLLMILVLLVSAFPQLAVSASSYTVSFSINGINVLRLTDYMVIYNNRGTYTNTNVYGYEVVVTSGVVTSLGGNNSFIPNEAGSFVVSGHGSSIDWLKENVVIGMKASYTSSKVTFTYDNSTVLKRLELNVEKMQSVYNNAAATYRLINYNSLSSRVDLAVSTYNTLKAAYEANNSYDLETNGAPLLAEIKDILSLCTESASVEIRGVWIRPTQITVQSVNSYVQQLYEAGINMVCIETLYNSTMIMPMPSDSLFEQNPAWAGFDMLQAFIDACHARDMELHVWMPIFYVGHGNSSNYELSVGAKKPEWLSLTNTGSYHSPSDGGKYMFLSPANQEVRKFLLGTYEYILTNYNIDGFQLDYIRYTDRGVVDFGYDTATLNAFRAIYGITPSYDTKAGYWDNWVAFRAQQVTDMVISVRTLINRVAPQVVLSADVGADLTHAYNNLYQDSVRWLNEGYLDMIHPMAYGEGYVQLMEQYLSLAGDCYVGVGLGAYMDEFDASDMLRQATDMVDIKAAGSVYFEAGSFLNKGCGSLLATTLYRNRALSPTYDERRSVLLLTEQAKKRIDEAILPLGGVTAAKANEVKAKLNQITTSAQLQITEQTLVNINDALTTINTIPNNAAKQALAEDINYAKSITEKAFAVMNSVTNYFSVETLSGGNTAIGFNSDTIRSMTAADAKALLGGTVTVKNKNGNPLNDSATIGTGCVLSNGKYSYTMVIMGDISGDGIITSVDYLMTKRIFLGTYAADAFQTRAAALTDGITPRAVDYLKIKRHFLGTYDIYS